MRYIITSPSASFQTMLVLLPMTTNERHLVHLNLNRIREVAAQWTEHIVADTVSRKGSRYQETEQ